MKPRHSMVNKNPEDDELEDELDKQSVFFSRPSFGVSSNSSDDEKPKVSFQGMTRIMMRKKFGLS